MVFAAIIRALFDSSASGDAGQMRLFAEHAGRWIFRCNEPCVLCEVPRALFRQCPLNLNKGCKRGTDSVQAAGCNQSLKTANRRGSGLQAPVRSFEP